MPSTYSTNLKIELQANGENSTTWGTITNTNLGTALEQAIVGYGNPSFPSDANLTLSYTDTNAAQAARALVLNVTSAVSLSTTRELVVPTIQKQYIVQNNTSGSQSITVKTAAGSGVTVPNGRKAHLYVNGTDVIYMDDYVDINGGAIDGTPIGASSASTGSFTTLATSGAVTLSGGTANGVLYLNGSKVATSGSALVFDGTNLGVGVTPSYKLDVLGSGAAAAFRINNATAGKSAMLVQSNGATAGIIGLTGFVKGDSSTNLGFFAETGFDLRFYTNGSATEKAVIDTSGNLGIGTASPSYKLDVNGVGRNQSRFIVGPAVDSSDRMFYVSGNTSTSGASQFGAVINPTLPNTVTSSAYGIYTGLTIASGATVTNGYGLYLEGMSAGGSTVTNKWGLYVADTNNSYIGGNLGIGTTSPAYKLDVSGAMQSSVASGNGAVYINNSSLSGKFWTFIPETSSGESNLLLYYGGTGAGTKLTLTNSGNVGLGVTPSAWGSGTYTAFQVGSRASFAQGASDTYVGNNWFNDGANKYLATAAASLYGQSAGVHAWYNAPSGTAGNTITFTQAMTLDFSGNLGLGVTPSAWTATFKALQVSNTIIANNGSADSFFGSNYYFNGTNNVYISSAHAATYGQVDGAHQWYTAPSGTAGNAITFTQAMTLDASGNFVVGNTTANERLEIYKGISYNADPALYFRIGANDGAVNNNAPYTWRTGITGSASGHSYVFQTLARTESSWVERGRFTSGGVFLVGKTASTLTTAGCELNPVGLAAFTRSADAALAINRLTDDGTLVEFQQDNVAEGSISVSGNTVSYNAFAGSHWSQLQDGSKPDILRGTVMESINELCVWPGENNERLPKSKVSDTAGSKKVYGVFMAWDNDWTETNDMYVTAVGAFICRINSSVTVQEGDLLESNGDGTARVQADDIIRSSTIGKVTSTVKTHEYDDGSYCVPTVLYCG